MSLILDLIVPVVGKFCANTPLEAKIRISETDKT
jgi:hypothetical protein